MLAGTVNLGAVAGGQQSRFRLARQGRAQALERGFDLIERKSETAPQVQRRCVMV
jgi:hypothetical protein